MKVRVVFEYDETVMGENWMNIDNLKLLLYSQGFATMERLFTVVSYMENTQK